jgi:hypothetical protein
MKTILAITLGLITAIAINGCKSKEEPVKEETPAQLQVSLKNGAGGGVTFTNALDPNKPAECGPLTRKLRFECPGYTATVTIEISLADPNNTNTCSGSDGQFLMCVPAK